MPNPIDMLPLVPALPLAGVVLLVLFGGRLGGAWSGRMATTLVGLAFVLSTAIAWEQQSLVGEDGHPPVIEQRLWRWMHVDQQVDVTVAAEEIEGGTELTAEHVTVVRLPRADTSAGVELSTSIVRMWLPDEAVGRVAREYIAPREILTDMNIAPGERGPRPFREVAVVGAFEVDIGLRLDALAVLMLLVVTGVGFLIHLYSIGYMAHDQDQRRYFAYLNLFVFSMLVLVLGADFLTLFVGWELVGACSYLLIGFWHKSEANASAGRKAFIVNRIGDLCFIVGLMLVWTTFGSLAFADVLPNASMASGSVALAIPLLLLAGATGKSAQVPLYVWLPDAMAGPTPVSALIHAATMVTAGVYMIARVHPLFDNAPAVMAVVAVVGVTTALLAALFALVQVDVKRFLAYSTISQLGFMFLAVGAGAYVAGVFHLMTHAFFKALLFLGAGSVMHAMEHGFGKSGKHPTAVDDVPPEQDMRYMGGLLGRLPITGWTFLIGGLALAGIFPLAGFWSKDEILLETLAQGGIFWTVLYILALFTAFLTALYTGRALLLTLYGSPRSEGAARAQESPSTMTIPLIVLAVLSVVGGLPVLAMFGAPLPHALEPVLGAHHTPGGPSKLVMALIATAVAVGGLFTAWWHYGRQVPDMSRMAGSGSSTTRALWRTLWVDEFYRATFVVPFARAAGFLWRVIDDVVIDGTVNRIGRTVLQSGQGIRRWQSGMIRGYALSIVLGAALVTVWLLVAAQ